MGHKDQARAGFADQFAKQRKHTVGRGLIKVPGRFIRQHQPWLRRKRARETVSCEISRFVKEMKLDEGDAVPTEEEVITPQNRLANLKALLQKTRAA